jgi:hypothetical protein
VSITKRLKDALQSHVKIGPLTVFGDNAMHFAAQLRIGRGYLTARPTTYRRGLLRRWYAYYSPDATPQAAWWAIGPGIDREDQDPVRRAAVRMRRQEAA